MKYQHFYTPTDYTTITPEMVKRWMALEQRLDEMFNLNENDRGDDFIYSRYDVLEMLAYIKDGNHE